MEEEYWLSMAEGLVVDNLVVDENNTQGGTIGYASVSRWRYRGWVRIVVENKALHTSRLMGGDTRTDIAP
jgi:hypothetical protein